MLLLASWSATVAAQPRVVVRSESRIELRTRRGAEEVVVQGALRDDLGQPLPSRDVHIQLTPSIGGAQVRRTDTDGSFRVTFPVVVGAYRLNAWFGGDSLHERVQVQRQLDLSRADVRLRVDVPDGNRFDLDVPFHELTVRATSDVGGAGLRVDVLDELERALGSGVTDASGGVRFVLASASLGRPGAGRLKVRSAADASRAEAQTEVPIVRFLTTTLTLHSGRSSAGAGEPVHLTGALSDSRGGIEGRAVGLFVGDRHLTTSLTDGAGQYGAEVMLEPTSDAAHVDVVARFQSDAPGRLGSESEPVRIEVTAAAAAPWLWLLAPVGLCLLLLAWIARRAPPPLERATAPPPPAPTGVSASPRVDRRPERRDVGGRVVSHDAEEPLGGAATVRDTAGRSSSTNVEDGEFRFVDLPEGRYLLRVVSASYVPAEAVVQIPHRGEHSGMVVRLESMRARALAPFRRIAIGILRSTRKWPIRTNREVLEAARAIGPTPRSLPELTERVEQACYGPTAPDHPEVEAIERLAAAADAPAGEDPSETQRNPPASR